MKYYVYAQRVDLDNFVHDVGTVGYDNEPTDDFDNRMIFDSKADAEAWTQSAEAKKWIDCEFEICEDY